MVSTPMGQGQPIFTGWRAWIADRLGIQPWGQVLIAALIVLGVLLWVRLGTIDDKLNNQATALKVLPLELSKELLSQAQESIRLAHTDKALRSTDIASALIVRASLQKLQAPPDYFADVTRSVNELQNSDRSAPDVKTSAAHIRELLAEYRASLQVIGPQKNDKSIERSLDPSDIIPAAQAAGNFSPATLGNTSFVWGGRPGGEFIVAGMVKSLGRQLVVEDLTFNGKNTAIQTLDGIHWNNVAFVHMKILYQGGEVELKNTIFIDCTFEVSPSLRGQQVLDFVSLRGHYLKIGGTA